MLIDRLKPFPHVFLGQNRDQRLQVLEQFGFRQHLLPPTLDHLAAHIHQRRIIFLGKLRQGRDAGGNGMPLQQARRKAVQRAYPQFRRQFSQRFRARLQPGKRLAAAQPA